jgi:osmotically-inducible protein OsmY
MLRPVSVGLCDRRCRKQVLSDLEKPLGSLQTWPIGPGFALVAGSPIVVSKSAPATDGVPVRQAKESKMKQAIETESAASLSLRHDARQAELLARRIDLVVRQATGQAVRSLEVEVNGQIVRLRGFCSTFYSKQLAQQAVMAVLSDEQLFNEIEVAY